MAKVKAADLIPIAESYIGRPYSEMDCQAFFERVLYDAGINYDKSGTNAMFRDVHFRGCLPIGIMLSSLSINKLPAGAVLLIWANDGGEPAKYKEDGQGNCSHIGFYDGAGHAIHSSKSKGKVVKTDYNGHSEINGGWNYVAFPDFLVYDDKIEKTLNQWAKEDAWMDTVGDGNVIAENGQPVNVRSGPGRSFSSKTKLAVGTDVSIIRAMDDEWLYIEYGGGKTGYIMRKFVEMLDEEEDAEEPIVEHTDDSKPLSDLLRTIMEKAEELRKNIAEYLADG